jgi:hypothetical protein
VPGEEAEAGEMSVYPNPANDLLHIALPEAPTEKGEFYLMNQYGQVVANVKVDGLSKEYEVSTKSQANGLYLFGYRGAKGLRWYRQVVVQHE